jgi:hypothetical protein
MRVMVATLGIVAMGACSGRALADTCNGTQPCDSTRLAVAGIVIGGIVEGSVAIAGIVAAAGGAKDLARGGADRRVRIANYVIGGLNLAAATAWGGFAAAGISQNLTFGFGITHFIIGSAGLGMAIASSIRASRSHRYSFQPVFGDRLAGALLRVDGLF